jgi:signal transduction histidine kinase/CheY-like chemotaxis protein
MTAYFSSLFANRSIRFVMAVSFALLFVLPIALLAVVLALQSSQQSRAQIVERLDDNAVAVSRAIEAYIDRHRQGVSLLVANLPAEVRRNAAARDRVVERNQAVFDGFLNTLLIDKNGDVEAFALSPRLGETAPPREVILKTNVLDREYFTAVRDSGESYVSDVFRGRGIGNDWLVAMSAPLLGTNEAFDGIAAGFLDLSRFNDIWSRHQRLDGADLTLLDPSNRVIFSTRTEQRRVEWAMPLMKAWTSTDTPVLAWALPSEQEDVAHLVAVQALDNDWHALVSVPAERYREVFWQSISDLAWFVVLALVVLGLFAWGVGQRVAQPLERLAEYVRSFASQHGEWRASDPIAEAPRELRLVLHGFNDVAEQLSRSLRELRESNVQESALRVELETVVREREQEIERRTEELREQSQQLALAANAKSEFLANMSHEMRTPLTAIIGFVETLLDEPDIRDSTRKRLTTVLGNSRHLARLIGDVLDLSKVDAGGLDLEWREVALNSVVSDVVSSQSHVAHARDLELEVQLEGRVPARLRTDSTRLRQVLFNLTSNAIKFTHQGKVIVRLSSPKPDRLRIDVIDTGIGIEADTLQRLFTRFQQADSSVTRQYGGTGLGLVISKELVMALGGEIQVSSEPECGSTFSVELPIGLDGSAAGSIECLDDLLAVSETARSGPVGPLSGRVLVAEDSEHNQELIGLLLERRELQYELVNNGRQAIDKVFTGAFDLVLMDMHMPVMGGLDATREIRAAGFRVPVIALTADVLTGHQEAQRRAGCNATMAKPIDRGQFDDILNQWLAAPHFERKAPVEDKDQVLNDAIVRLREKFIGGLEAYMGPVHTALAAADMEILAAALHKLTGSSGSFGFDELSRLSAAVEARLRDAGQVGPSDACVEALLAEAERLAPERSA